MKLAIVGCRNWGDDPSEVEAFIRARIRKDLEMFRPEEVISGGARGVDTWAVEEAKAMGIPTHVIRPKNPRWEPEGFKERNIAIAKRCTDLLSIRCTSGPCIYTGTEGAKFTANMAQEYGRVVRRILA